MTTLTLCELPDPGIPGIESFSPFCLKVHRGLRAAGLSYTRRHGAHPGVFRDLDPAEQVPVLLVGDEAIGDSTRILARLSQLGTPLHGGPDPRARAEALLVEELADTSINAFLVASRWLDDRNWPATRDAYFAGMPALIKAFLPGRIRARVFADLRARAVWRRGPAACWESFELLLAQLEARAPASGWWVGDRLSVADLALFGQLQSFRTALTPWQRERVESHATLRAYLDRVDHATREVSYALAA